MNNNDFATSSGIIHFDNVKIYERTESNPPLPPSPPPSQIYAYHNDHLGTPLALVDTNHNVVWQTTRNAWGKRLVETTQAGVMQPFDLPGQYYDQETALDYNWNRYYDPNTGRYVEGDPLAVTTPASGNPYSYATDRPMNMIDPKGLQTQCGSGGDPGQLAACVAACEEGIEATEEFCRSLPEPRARALCWATALLGGAACNGTCYALFGSY